MFVKIAAQFVAVSALLLADATQATAYSLGQRSNDAAIMPACTSSHASPQEQQRNFESYVSIFYNKTHPNPTKAMKLYVAKDLIQHNPNIDDGRAAQIAAVAPIYREYDFSLQNTFFDPQKGYGIIYNAVYAKGDCDEESALECSKSTKVTDIYRFSGGCMVEHWDVLEDPEN